MNHRYTHFLIDVPIPGDPDLIAHADDEHLFDHARETLAETVGETPARWFEGDGVTDATATFRLRVGTAHATEPTDIEALHGALRVLREHTDGEPLDAGVLQYEGVTPTDPLGESGTHDSNTSKTDDTEIDTENDTAAEDTEPEPETDDGKYGIDRNDGDDDRQGLLASAMGADR